MTNKCDRLKNYKKINTEICVAKINESMTAKGAEMIDNCKLKDVVYIPELTTNLLSCRFEQ